MVRREYTMAPEHAPPAISNAVETPQSVTTILPGLHSRGVSPPRTASPHRPRVRKIRIKASWRAADVGGAWGFETPRRLWTRTVRANGLGRLYRSAVTLSRSTNRPWTAARPPISNATACGVRPVGARRPAISNVVETPQSVTTNLPGLHSRGVSPPRTASPHRPRVRKIRIKASWRAADVGGAWGFETPRRLWTRTVRANGLGRLYRSAVTLSRSTNRPWTAARPPISNATACGVRPVGARRPAISNVVETPQSVTTNLPGVHSRGVSPPRTASPHRPRVRKIRIKTSWRAADVGGAWGLETPRRLWTRTVRANGLGRLYRSAVTLSRSTNRPWTAARPPISNATACGVRPVGARRPAISNVVETPQSVTTNLPGVHSRGVSPPRTASPHRPRVRKIRIKTSWRAADVGGAWGLETPRRLWTRTVRANGLGRLYRSAVTLSRSTNRPWTAARPPISNATACGVRPIGARRPDISNVVETPQSVTTILPDVHSRGVSPPRTASPHRPPACENPHKNILACCRRWWCLGP